MPLALGYIWTVDWSPDARWMVCRAQDLRGQQAVYLADTVTGAKRPLAVYQRGEVGHYLPQFADDGQSVTYLRARFANAPEGRGQDLARYDLASGAESVIHANIQVEAPRGLFYQGRSPDGRYLTGMSTADDAPTSLYIYDTTTRVMSEAFRVDLAAGFNVEGGVQWSADSQALFVNARAPGDINARALWRIPVDGSPPVELQLDRASIVNLAIAVHPDGRQVAFLAGTPVAGAVGGPPREFRILERLLPSSSGGASNGGY